MKQILRIDLSSSSFTIEPVSAQLAKLGGRGLTSQVISQEVPPQSDPLGPDNKLVFAPGILAATNVPCSGRLSVGTKSPLTNGIKEANAGGIVGQQLAKMGIRGIIIEGVASDLTLLEIETDTVKFVPVPTYAGMGNYQCVDELKKQYGKDVGIISIGPAGERQLKASAISASTKDHHLRLAARGGVGAVMGSKNLKAIVINDAKAEGISIGNKSKLQKSAKAFSQGLLKHPLMDALKALGTPVLVNMIDSMGALSTKNYSQGKFEKAELISGEHLAEIIASRPKGKTSHRCMPGCVIQCSNVLNDEKGKLICSSIEFETIALMGSNCMIDDIELVAEMNRACNDLGLDTMDVGGAIAVAMDCGMIPWGDGKAAMGLIEEIAKGTENGLMIGNGTAFTGEKLGAKRIPTVKGQCLSGYDPRGLKGTGVTYATATMGADHTCGNALPSPTNPDYNPVASTGQAPVSKYLQGYFAAIDSLGMCLFSTLPILDIPELKPLVVDAVSAVFNESLAEDYIEQLGESINRIERKYNLDAGMTNNDDRLPRFFTQETLESLGTTFDVSEAELDSVHN